ncbi:hypothetical protein ACFL1G_03580 [Planctomycetota bacterium]
MNKKKKRENGFVLLLVVAMLGLIGAEMFVLTGGSNVILLQTDTVYLQACRDNLRASALAWAQMNVKNNAEENFDKTIQLDVSEMQIPRSELSVTISAPEMKKAKVEISASCSRSRQTLKCNEKYYLDSE